MFDIGWSELLVIGVVALIVIGPKDLPVMFQQLGRFTGKLRMMAREFQSAMEQAAKESGASDVAADLKSMASTKGMGMDKVRAAADRFEKWDPLKGGSTPMSDPNAPARPAAAPVAATPAAEAAAAPAAPPAETPAPAEETKTS